VLGCSTPLLSVLYRKSLLLSLLLFLVAASGWGLFFFRPAWFPLAISSAGLAWDQQFGWTMWIAGIIFTAAQLGLAWALLRKRRTPDSGAGKPEPAWLEYTWTGATAVLFLALAAAGSRTWAKMPDQNATVETIEVYAHQFAWNFRYPGPDGRFGRTQIDQISDSGGNPMGVDPKDPRGRDDITTATLRVPVGRNVLLVFHSRDVIHDFFVRELRTKQDVVPGMEIPLEIRVDRPGEYEIACAELCGLGHSQMRSLLIAMPPAEYDQWKATAADQK
jgi:cytochrome c oxidase subunit 2